MKLEVNIINVNSMWFLRFKIMNDFYVFVFLKIVLIFNYRSNR